jgi:microcystin-dependent protein
VPAGWLPCDGRAIDRIAYSSLFAAIGETWGNGDGTTTFNIPDLRGRTTIGHGKCEGGSALSLSASDAAKAAPSEHKLGDYDGSEKFGRTAPSFSSHFANRKYCILYNGHADDWCFPGYRGKHGSYANTITGEFDPGSLTSTIDMDRINMMPFATVSYIIKT